MSDKIKPLFIPPENKESNSVRKDILTANKRTLIHVFNSPNKAIAIEKLVLGNVAHGITGLIAKVAATEAFSDEMEKIAHTFNQVWSKVGIKEQNILNIVRESSDVG